MSARQIIGAIAFAPSPDGTTQTTQKIGPFIMSEEGTKRLLKVLAEKSPSLSQNITVQVAPASTPAGDTPLVDPDDDFSNATITEIPGCVGGHQEARAYAVYHLVGEDMETLARNIKSYAFAYALALRWSEMLGQTVKMMRRTNVDAERHASTFECIEAVNARDTTEGEYLSRQISAEITRLQNAKIAMREVADDVRCMIEDADDAITGLRALAGINAIPAEYVAQAARAAADHFDTLHWYTLINTGDTEMIGELAALPDAAA